MIDKNEFDGHLIFGGRDFHKKSSRAGVAESLRSKKYPLFFEYSNGCAKRKKDAFEELIECPLCGSSDLVRNKIIKDALLIDQCNKCSFGFQNPRVKRSMLPALYTRENTHNYQRYASSGSQQVDYFKNGYGIEQSLMFNKEISNALDVGAGDYSFLMRCIDYGIEELYGVDPGCLAENKDIDKRITQCDDFFVDGMHWEYKQVDLVTMWDTLEHIIDFESAIKSIKKILSRNGILLVMVPNFYSLATRLIREKSPTFNLQHVNYFNENSLDYLLQKCDMKILKKETVISEIDNCRNYIDFTSDVYMSSASESSLTPWLTVDYIHDNMLGSRLFYLCTHSK